jgi:nucleoside 2-deoxyribosyltransferase
MFSIADKGEQDQIKIVLEGAGFTTYLPHHEGIEVAKAMMVLITGLPLPPSDVADIISFAEKIGFALDIFQIVERCNSLVFNMDGRVPDEGSVVEAAVAFATCKPIVTFKTTPVTILGGYDNPMVQGLTTNWKYVSDLALLPAAVSNAVAARPDSGKHKPCEHMKAIINLGREVWANIGAIRAAIDDAPAPLLKVVRELEQLWSTELNAAYGPYAVAHKVA